MTSWPEYIGGYRRSALLDCFAKGVCETFLAARPGESTPDTELTVIAPPPEDAELFFLRVDEVAGLVDLYGRLQHPAFEKVFDIGRADHLAFIASEHLQGVPLSALAPRPDSAMIDIGVAAALVASAAEAIETAHALQDGDGRSLRIVHGFISAKRIVLTAEGRVVVRGLLRERLVGGFHRYTKSSDGIEGAHPLVDIDRLVSMPPEVWGAPHTEYADVYALAAVLFELTTGARYLGWEAKNLVDLLQLVRNNGARRPSSIVPSYPPELETLLFGVLRQGHRRTPVPAGTFARSLRDFAERHGATPERVQLFVHRLFAHAP
ncbi:hypothetical protein [Pendulispora albinea]|uniref:Protein kinase domain-containing protein n=1 Tax=Pendulispora albinea TaxID=2741071 RepID=A0ABZ2LZG9_9BACT